MNPTSPPGNGPSTSWADAARLLEQVVKAGLQDPPVLLLLVQAYQRLGRIPDARTTLTRVTQPDASIYLQRGLLAFRDKDFAQAAEDFQQARERVPDSFPPAYNLFLARLWANQLDKAREALAAAQGLAPNEGEKRFLSLLHLLLHTLAGGQPPAEAITNLSGMTAAEEQRLLDLLVGLGRFEVAYPLLSRLVAVRPTSPTVFRVFFGAVLVQAKQFMDRNQWEEAKILLAPVRRRIDQHRANLDPMLLLVLYQMLGVCSAMLQDFEQAAVWFSLALEIGQKEAVRGDATTFVNVQGVPQLAWLEQNLALVHEWLNRPQKAEAHWKRYVELLEQNLAQSRPPEHLPTLVFECQVRLAELAQKGERWNEALELLQRAHRVRPTDYETLEKLFNLYSQLRRSDEARKVLRRMREVRPNDPQVELFELDVREVRSVEEVETVLQDLRRVAQKFPGDLRVDERTKSTLHHLLPTLEKFSEQYSAQMQKVVDQMRRLPSYQVNWPVVRDVMRDLEDQFTHLRRVAQKMQALTHADDQRRDLQRLLAHCDRKIDQCSSLAR